MIHPILIYGNEMLREKSGLIPQNFPKLHELIADMFETMHKANGVGLSAIQIGVPLRIFVIDAHLEEENFHFRGIFINPIKIKEHGEEVNMSEGCLSLPQIVAQVKRPSKIELEYYDEHWEKHIKKFSGYEARIIQHEYDHLEGILYTDKMNRMYKHMLARPMQQIRDKEINVEYLTK